MTRSEAADSDARDIDPGPDDDGVWQRARGMTSARSRFGSLFLLFLGMTPWLHWRRLDSLENSACARFLHNKTAGWPRPAVRRLETRARINRESAASAFRQIVVANVTIPVAAIAVVNELTDGGVVDLGLQLLGTPFWLYVMLAGFVVVVVLYVLYSYAVASVARDLHLTVQLVTLCGSAEGETAEPGEGVPD